MKLPFVRRRLADERLARIERLEHLLLCHHQTIQQQQAEMVALRKRGDVFLREAEEAFPSRTAAEVLAFTDAGAQAMFISALANMRFDRAWPVGGWDMQIHYMVSEIADKDLNEVENLLDNLLSTVKHRRDRRRDKLKPEKEHAEADPS